jgi:hypothetical protein
MGGPPGYGAGNERSNGIRRDSDFRVFDRACRADRDRGLPVGAALCRATGAQVIPRRCLLSDCVREPRKVRWPLCSAERRHRPRGGCAGATAACHGMGMGLSPVFDSWGSAASDRPVPRVLPFVLYNADRQKRREDRNNRRPDCDKNTFGTSLPCQLAHPRPHRRRCNGSIGTEWAWLGSPTQGWGALPASANRGISAGDASVFVGR